MCNKLHIPVCSLLIKFALQGRIVNTFYRVDESREFSTRSKQKAVLKLL